MGFTNVRLPLVIQHDNASAATAAGVPVEDIDAVINFMFQKFTEDYHTFINILYFSGSLWARLSATVYLDIDDFEYGGLVLKQICQRIDARDYKCAPYEACSN